jgi:carbamoyltransferase
MNILGISALYHDSAAALIMDGETVAAAQEERFTRKKHDAQFPENAINYVLYEAKISMVDIDYVVFYDKPFLKFERLLETYVSLSPRGFNSFRMAMPIWLREKLFLKDFLIKQFKKYDQKFESAQLMFSEHHFSHAASAFYPSPFEEALVLTLDGVGEWATTSVAIGKGNKLNIVKELHFPHSLGLLYSAFTFYTGFKVNSGEYKLMGLAPYGNPRFKDIILEKLVDLKEDGSFRLDQSYFNYSTGLTMTNKKFSSLFSCPPRKPDSEELTQFHMDIAASIQAVTEEIIIKIARGLRREYDIPNLCLAGGVALNCVANGKILRDKCFENIWIQPAAGDAGGAIGAALALWHNEFNSKRAVNTDDAMKGAFLGPSYSEVQATKELTSLGANFKQLSHSEMINTTARLLSESNAVGWFQGRMEFGPRALGGRSILGDPRSEVTQKNLNLKVKYRESFRPFAPSVLAEKVSEWFEHAEASPYMLIVANVRESIQCEINKSDELLFGIERLNIKRSSIPAVTHVDYSARIQTVHRETNPAYYELISEFGRITGCPILVNTSFNVRGEPIVCTPTDAFKCFMGTELDVLVIGNLILFKSDQDSDLLENYRDKYELD